MSDAAAPVNDRSAARSGDGGPPAGGDTLIAVRDLKVHFPITTGIVFRIASAPCAPSTACRSTSSAARRSGSSASRAAASRPPAGPSCSSSGRPLAPYSTRAADLARLSAAPVRAHRRQMQMIFQDPYASLNSRMTLADIVGEPLKVHKLRPRRERLDRVRELARPRGHQPQHPQPLPARVLGRPAAAYRHRPRARRRARVHRLRRAHFGARRLDPRTDHQPCCRSSRDVSRSPYLFIAHDLSVVRHISDRVAVMYLGRIVELADNATLYERAVPSLYAGAALSACRSPIPTAEELRRAVVLQGDVPSPADPPSGCHFHTRCPAARPRTLRRQRPRADRGSPQPLGCLPSGDRQRLPAHRADEFDVPNNVVAPLARP